MNNCVKYIYGGVASLGLMLMTSCTDLSEKLYDTIGSENFYQTHDDVIRGAFRPYEHAFWSVGATYEVQENSSDEMATYNREQDWYNEGIFERVHYHTWNIEDDEPSKACWDALFEGVMFCNSSIEDLSKLNPEQFGFTQADFDGFSAGLRTLRAWFYIRALDLYRNIPLAVSLDASKNSVGQVSPQDMFNFIEKELKECLELLPQKAALGGNQLDQGLWNKAGAASLLVRLYLNAEKWIGKPMYTECAQYAEDIISGKYGPYKIDTRWDAPYDWDNVNSDEVIYAFTGAYSRAHWHYGNDMYWWSMPGLVGNYLGFKSWGNSNPKFALQPSLDVDGNPYTFTLGRPVAKFKKYPEDVRLKLYKNLDAPSTREGMFLYGYLEYKDDQGNIKRVKKPGDGYTLYIRDQVGKFLGAAPDAIIDDKVSNIDHADHNSGWHVVKYPFYRDGDPGAIEADYTEIRLAEIYYSLAECKFRAGDVQSAGTLLNTVRKRYYPEDKWQEYLYQPDGNVILTEDELLDEWMREFCAEGRRRTDLIRWNRFSQGTWWDKQPDADTHTEILPLSKKTLQADLNLKQNPGYEDPR